MSKEAADPHLTLALNTTLEKDFLTPLTSIRGALEILRDFPDLSEPERELFFENALQDCARLERGIDDLAATVYAAGSGEPTNQAQPSATESEYDQRIGFFPDLEIVDIDFSDFAFTSSSMVNEFYDRLDKLIENSNRRWYLILNYRNFSIWPEAWVAFAHRGKKVNVSYSLGTVRYIDKPGNDGDSTPDDPDIRASRDLALASIEEMRKASPRSGAQLRIG